LVLFNFDQTRHRNAFHILAASGDDETERRGIMAVPKDNRHKDYSRYAAHCLGLTHALTDREDRAINREMAAEWLKLAEATVELSKPIK
jgi:hypothetical protein